MNWSNEWGKPTVTLPDAKVGDTVTIENKTEEVLTVIQPTTETIEINEPAVSDETVYDTPNFIVASDGDVLTVTLNNKVERIFNLTQIMLRIEQPEKWPIDIEATIVGDLAVHKPIQPDNNWRITHIPTNAKFDRALPSTFYNDNQLIEWCAKVQSGSFDDWDLLRELNRDSVGEENMELRDRIFKWCREIKIK